MLYKFLCCNCGHCKWLRDNYDKDKWYKINKKSNKKRFQKKKNKLRRYMFKQWIKWLRKRNPIKDELPLNLKKWWYSD